MNLKDLFWHVEKVHNKESYNDYDKYKIVNYSNVSTQKTSDDRELLEDICFIHNQNIITVISTYMDNSDKGRAIK